MTPIPEPGRRKINRMSYFQMHQALGWLLFESIHGDTYDDKGITELAEDLGNHIYDEIAAQPNSDFIDGDIIHLVANSMWNDLTAHFGDDLARETYPVMEVMPADVRENIFAAEDEAPHLYDAYNTKACDTDLHAKVGIRFFCLVSKQLRDRKYEASVQNTITQFLQDTAFDNPEMPIRQHWANRGPT